MESVLKVLHCIQIPSASTPSITPTGCTSCPLFSHILMPLSVVMETVGEISGSHRDLYEYDCLLCVAPCTVLDIYRHFRDVSVFIIKVMWFLFMEAIITYETSVDMHGATSHKTVTFMENVFVVCGTNLRRQIN